MRIKLKDLFEAYEQEMSTMHGTINRILQGSLKSSIYFVSEFKTYVSPVIYVDDDLCFCFDFITDKMYLSISIGEGGNFHWARVCKNVLGKAGGTGNISIDYDKKFLRSLLDDLK